MNRKKGTPKKFADLLLQKDGDDAFSEAQALVSFAMDQRKGNQWTEKGYAALWGWSRDRVRYWIDSIEKIHQTLLITPEMGVRELPTKAPLQLPANRGKNADIEVSGTPSGTPYYTTTTQNVINNNNNIITYNHPLNIVGGDKLFREMLEDQIKRPWQSVDLDEYAVHLNPAPGELRVWKDQQVCDFSIPFWYYRKKVDEHPAVLSFVQLCPDERINQYQRETIAVAIDSWGKFYHWVFVVIKEFRANGYSVRHVANLLSRLEGDHGKGLIKKISYHEIINSTTGGDGYRGGDGHTVSQGFNRRGEPTVRENTQVHSGRDTAGRGGIRYQIKESGSGDRGDTAIRTNQFETLF